MMTSKEYEIRRDGLLRQQAPFVVMEKNGLVAEGENYYRIGDVHVEVTSEVQSELDLLIGLKSKQSNGFRNAYGDKAVAGLRNSFAMADCVSDSRKFVLIANPSERIVDGIVPIREEVIPMQSFFEIVEMFADKHGYEVDQLQSYGNAVYGVTVRLMPVRPQYDAPVSDDEFVTNGLYMKWSLGEIELGSYYLQEKEASEGYLADPEQYEFEIVYKDEKTPVVEISDYQGKNLTGKTENRNVGLKRLKHSL